MQRAALILAQERVTLFPDDPFFKTITYDIFETTEEFVRKYGVTGAQAFNSSYDRKIVVNKQVISGLPEELEIVVLEEILHSLQTLVYTVNYDDGVHHVKTREGITIYDYQKGKRYGLNEIFVGHIVYSYAYHYFTNPKPALETSITPEKEAAYEMLLSRVGYNFVDLWRLYTGQILLREMVTTKNSSSSSIMQICMAKSFANLLLCQALQIQHYLQKY
jgi:hypothetical protein